MSPGVIDFNSTYYRVERFVMVYQQMLLYFGKEYVKIKMTTKLGGALWYESGYWGFWWFRVLFLCKGY